MVQLSAFAAEEASKEHQVNSPEFFDAGKRIFFRHLDHLREEARKHAAQQPTEPTPTAENIVEPAMTETSPFFRPTPAPLPRRQEPSRRSVVSAPVSRESGLLSDGFDRKGQHTLSAAEAEAARISGISATEYLRQKLKMLEAKARGEIV
jgi:hypothetical protein